MEVEVLRCRKLEGVLLKLKNSKEFIIIILHVCH